MRVVSLFFLLLFSINSSAVNIPEVNEFDIRYYHPESYGLKDLVFEVRVSNLVETLNKRQSFGKIEDLYFKVYWMFPGQYQIEVNGFPKGFEEVKYQLKQMIKNRLDFVVPLKLAPRVRSYELSYFKTSSGKGVRGKDRTGTRPVSEIQLKFKSNGMLEEFKTFSPTGVNSSTFDLGVKGWSNNKWVVDKMTIKLIQGVQLTTIENEFEYKSYNGFGFPEKVDIRTTQEIVTNNEKNKPNKRTVNSTIEFSKYEVNTGKAMRFMTKGIKK